MDKNLLPFSYLSNSLFSVNISFTAPEMRVCVTKEPTKAAAFFFPPSLKDAKVGKESEQLGIGEEEGKE